jgi:hypothetical protein
VSDDDDPWSWVLVALLFAGSIILALLLVFYWRRFWVPDFMFSTPIFSPGPEPVALGQRIVVPSRSALEKTLLYHVLEETLGNKKTK